MNIIFYLGVSFCLINLFILVLKLLFLRKESKKIIIKNIKELKSIDLLKIRFNREGTTLNLKNWNLCRLFNNLSKLIKNKFFLSGSKSKKFFLFYFSILDLFTRYIWINKDKINNLNFKFKPYLIPLEVYPLQDLSFKMTGNNKDLLPEQVLQILIDFCDSFVFENTESLFLKN
ncbi:MAG: hypothetical protein K2I76_04140 [Malacoplasma sp.]|nr:hypothetical protein [Malacoplasma sp.]